MSGYIQNEQENQKPKKKKKNKMKTTYTSYGGARVVNTREKKHHITKKKPSVSIKVLERKEKKKQQKQLKKSEMVKKLEFFNHKEEDLIEVAAEEHKQFEEWTEMMHRCGNEIYYYGLACDDLYQTRLNLEAEMRTLIEKQHTIRRTLIKRTHKSCHLRENQKNIEIKVTQILREIHNIEIKNSCYTEEQDLLGDLWNKPLSLLRKYNELIRKEKQPDSMYSLWDHSK